MKYFLIALLAFVSGFSAIFFRPFSKLIVGIANALTPGQRFKSNIFKNEEELRDLVDQAHLGSISHHYLGDDLGLIRLGRCFWLSHDGFDDYFAFRTQACITVF